MWLLVYDNMCWLLTIRVYSNEFPYCSCSCLEENLCNFLGGCLEAVKLANSLTASAGRSPMRSAESRPRGGEGQGKPPAGQQQHHHPGRGRAPPVLPRGGAAGPCPRPSCWGRVCALYMHSIPAWCVLAVETQLCSNRQTAWDR